MKKIDVLVEKRVKDILRVRRILLILDYVENSRTSVVEELKDLEVPRSSYYEWRKSVFLDTFRGPSLCLVVLLENPQREPGAL